MLSNYHTHTYLCNHAEGYLEDYLLVAKAEGLDILGFSDHCPYPRDGLDTWAQIRMSPEDAVKYSKDIKTIAKDKSIQIFSGFECEWDFRYESWYKDFLFAELEADYLVFGAHWVYDNGNFIYAPEIQTKKQLFKYFDTIIEGLASGFFSFLAHPDLIMANGRPWDENLKAGFNAVIEASIQYKIPLEINGQGLSRPKILDENGERYQYPYDKFWEIVGEKNLSVICNSDAHFPSDLLAGVKRARNYAKKMQLAIIEELNIK